jgi:hypothetical protein
MKYSIFVPAAGLLLQNCFLMGCGGGNQDEVDFSPGYVYATSSLPYVEEVELPEKIVAGEPFEVKLRLSAALHPELLGGVGLPNPLWSNSARFLLAPDAGFLWGAEGNVRIETWFTYQRNPDRARVIDAPPSNEAVFQLQLPLGEYVLNVSSADSAEWGGYQDRIMVIPSFEPPQSGHAIYQQYPISVVVAGGT